MPPLDPVDSQEVVAIGPHRLLCGQDMYFVECIGDVTAEHMPAFFALTKRYTQKNGYVLALVDASRMGTMSPEARRLSVAYGKQDPGRRATAIFGASLVTRTLATLLFKAIALITQRASESAFFKTEAEARAWLDEKRAAIIASLQQAAG